MDYHGDSLNEDLSPNIPPKEGKVTKAVEHYTAKLPSMTWLWMALGSMAVSAGIATLSERKSTANFVGLWVPTFLLFGIYNKLVKLEGSDQFSKNAIH
jgi:hypothetical protein